MRSIVYNSYAIFHLVFYYYDTIPPTRIYYTNIFTTPYNLTYTHCNSCPPYTFTNQILTHSPQLATSMKQMYTHSLPISAITNTLSSWPDLT